MPSAGTALFRIQDHMCDPSQLNFFEVESPLDSFCSANHTCLYSGHADRCFRVLFEATGYRAGGIVEVYMDRLTQSRVRGIALKKSATAC